LRNQQNSTNPQRKHYQAAKVPRGYDFTVTNRPQIPKNKKGTNSNTSVFDDRSFDDD